MKSEQVDRMRLGWSREDLARYSGVSVASVYLVERLGNSTEYDDGRIRDALARGLAARGSESKRDSARQAVTAGVGVSPRDLGPGSHPDRALD